MSVQQKPFKSSWVDSVPAHWEQLRLGRMARIYAGGTPDKANAAFWGGDIPWLNSGTVNQWMISEPSEYITEQGYEGSSARWVPKGALVMALAGQGKTKGMCAQLDIDATCNQSMAAILPDFGVSRYLLYWLSANYRNIRGMASDDLRDGLNLVLLGQIPVPVPPIAEQEAIAVYLDRETARIDELILEKEGLIGLLREYRQATISEAVTQGLDPATPKKPSGVTWLGEIPAHWGLKRLKFHVEPVGEKTSEPLAGVAYIGLEHIESGTGKFIASMDGTQTESESTVSHFCTGDVLFGKLRPYLAKAVIAYGDGVCTTELLVLRPRSMDAGYLLRCLLLDGFIKTVDASTFGAKMPRADWTFISNLLLPEPPVEEQQAIAAYLDHETARIDKLLAHVQDEIKLLQEFRAATITDAVTGKIQVS